MLISNAGIGRLSPSTVPRPRIGMWIEACKQSAVRLLVGPAGSGKTTILLQYAMEAQSAVAYCSLPAGCTVEHMRAQIARALGRKTPRSYHDLVQMLSGFSPAQRFELVVDEADNGSDETIDELHRLIEDIPANSGLFYAARSREHLRAAKLVARDIAEICDARRMCFTAEDCLLLARAHGIDAGEADARRLVEETDGWALAVSQSIRTSAAERETLDGGFAIWLTQAQPFLRDLIKSEIERLGESDRRTFETLLGGTARVDPSRLNELQARGLPIFEERGGYLRVFRVLRPFVASTATAPGTPFVPPLMAKVFGQFESSIDGREISWVRRRDQDIIKYLLLQPDARATRAELAATFWSDAEPHLATQSVRTACSTIRKAVAALVGQDRVDLYFRTVPDVQVVLSNVVCDARRFRAHCKDAEACAGSGDAEGAKMHFRAADKLYRGEVLAGEPRKAWFARSAETLHELHIRALESLASFALESEGNHKLALQYTARARAEGGELKDVIKLRERIAAVRAASQPPAASAPFLSGGDGLVLRGD